MKIKIIACLIMFALILVLANDALAMSSTNYALNWLAPVTSSGGISLNSTHYKAQVTIGQTVIGASNSTNYGVGLGFWYGFPATRLYLPLIVR